MNPAEEARTIVELERELSAAFPQLGVDKVQAVVEQEWMAYLHAPIRDFVPLLVRRQVESNLRVLAGGWPAGAVSSLPG